MNMLATITPKSDQLNSDDLIGRSLTIRVRDVKFAAGDDQPVSLFYDGDDNKPYKACKSMRRVLVHVWGPDAKVYVGRSMTLYRDPEVTFGGMKVGGIRISHMSDIAEAKTMALTATRANRKPFTVKPLVVGQQEDPAKKWADGFIAKIANCADAAALDALKAERATKLSELQGKRPEVYQQVADALALKADTFTDDASFDGPADEQRGETNVITPNDIIELIGRKVQQQDVISLVDSWADQIATFDEADVLRIDAAKAARIAELKAAA